MAVDRDSRVCLAPPMFRLSHHHYIHCHPHPLPPHLKEIMVCLMQQNAVTQEQSLLTLSLSYITGRNKNNREMIFRISPLKNIWDTFIEIVTLR